MDYLIVGGGISGLYCAYSLHKRLGVNNIMVVEKSERLGGRINTKFIDSTFLELGAGGVVDVQHNVVGLLEELGISANFKTGHKFYANLDVVMTNSSTPNIPTIYHINKMEPILETDFHDIMDSLYSKLSYPKFRKMAQKYNLYFLVEKFYGFDKAKKLMLQHGYEGDFANYNSVDALAMFQSSFSRNSKFGRVEKGMSNIIHHLVDYLHKHSIIMKTGCECLDIEKCDDSNVYKCILKDGIVEAKNIVFTMTKRDMLKIKYLDRIRDKLETVNNKELMRIYVIYPLVDGKVWFDKLDGTTTMGTLLGQITPINKKDGILMIYCDHTRAKIWDEFSKTGVLERELKFQLLKVFNDIDIPDPIKIYASYWDSATHLWKPGVDSEKMYNKLRVPIEGENIYIVGETYSMVQQWSEGAVQSVNDLVAYLEV